MNAADVTDTGDTGELGTGTVELKIGVPEHVALSGP